MAEFMNLAFISKSCYYSIQTTYLVPVVVSFWQEEQEAITDDILHRVDAGETIKIAGDGQCDSLASRLSIVPIQWWTNKLAKLLHLM